MTRILRFTKMQGLGNDFVVIDATKQPLALSKNALRRLADRHFGVGCDQILVVDPAPHAGVDFGYRIFNADGGEVEQCGNGARCFVKFVRQRGLSDKRAIRVQTAGGVIEPRLESGGEVTVDMGAPRFRPEDVPFSSESDALVQRLDLPDGSVEITALSMGNPHAVQVVDDVDAAPVTVTGPQIERHARFPQGVNAGYMQVVDRATIRLRVWERGVGETLACGTGACAAVATAIARQLCDSPVRVVTRGGTLTIAWQGPASPVMMTGAAEAVFEGEWAVDDR